MSTTPPTEQRPLLILGAGVIGLTTAVRLLESPSSAGRKVHIIADHHSTDGLDARYASSIAGAHHLSFADDADKRQRRWDMRTFRVLYEEWRKEGEACGLMGLTQTEMWVGSSKHLQIYEEHPDFKVLEARDAPCKVDHMVSFTSLTVTPSLYLTGLEARVRSLGGIIHRAHVGSLHDLATLPFLSLYSILPAAVFVCVGLGASSLLGIADQSVYPTRGQVVRVRAPWIRSGYTRQVGSLAGGEGGQRTYVIPRCTGDVILGGTREERDWDPYPRLETAKDILCRALDICPELEPPHARAPALEAGEKTLEAAWAAEMGEKEEKVKALEEVVVEHLVGFRPSRVGGTRLERAEVRLAGEIVALIHNYGHGGAGWQSSWGCAEDAVAIWEGKNLPKL
ncbi:hypothetical protein CcaverHIS002_0104760 [Cutaneotrichosporon cavernicola]|uniref:FAD dependent oxidoreductase domain-containing protein n=1 Tax=Cutaneotrichosporon cavernicola TaxID=279322 RepID=A0AA48IBF9_9TREE|nr:uncharacterized protein CcaverHIS019_0104690 [Cutaneotrichosporon cavernicola]BEI79947.1 hypothetical protein CcaverHIS002_0104760 [Cutaneotrichosporon cavernicola]BEI87751.1 hypothetical protein CcaverHIS019_0104690 [Cutaneotrichosporon cavernicola]BEI95524.1 hypothetical protein CcaverHIS631_0104730 [Cutaneotrichosporon cavernicola]BEJ03300.1 hypothetical protein CcaverHIS641_0104750 [Cutaneotrichosporon cavernicola]